MAVYNNFNEAWTGYQGTVTGLVSLLATLEYDLEQLNLASTWQIARNWTITCFRCVRDMVYQHTTVNWPNWNNRPHDACFYYAWTEAPPVEITMDNILNAMLASTFDQLQKFIGIEDAYRVALWNAPFNADFYAALARGFQKWP